jgi:hypothetical protein
MGVEGVSEHGLPGGLTVMDEGPVKTCMGAGA